MAQSLSQFNYTELARSLGLPIIPETGLDMVRSDYWDIADTIPGTGIILLHYRTEALPKILTNPDFSAAERDALLQLRGLIVDTAAPGGVRVLARSFGYTPSVTVDKLPTDGSLLELKDQHGVSINLDLKTAIFQPRYDGTLLRKWKYTYTDADGKEITRVFASTHRRIDASKSHWGKSKPFTELYTELGGPSDDELFGPQPISNFCYIFLISHPDLLTAFKGDIGDGWLFLLRNLEINTPGTDPRVEWVRHWSRRLDVPSLEDEYGNEVIPVPPAGTQEDVKAGTIYAPSQFGGKYDPSTTTGAGRGVRIANRILHEGYSEVAAGELKGVDYRLLPGEAIVCMYDGGRRMLNIAPRCYNWRTALNGNNANRFNQFYKLLDYSIVGPKAKEGKGEIFDGTERSYSYDELFPYIGTPTAKEFEQLGEVILKEGPLRLPPTTYRGYPASALNVMPKDRSYDPRDLRMRNIALCLTMAVPIAAQVQITGHPGAPGYYARFISRREDLITAMSRRFQALEISLNSTQIGSRLLDDINFRGDSSKYNTAGAAVHRLITQARAYVATRLKQGNTMSALTGKKLTREHDLALDNLRNLLKKEHGTSLYALERAFLEPQEPKVPAKLPALPLPSA